VADNDLSSVTGLPDELNIEDDLARADTELTVEVEERRYDKAMTTVSGFKNGETDLGDLASGLKSSLACGGTTTDETIELQGDHIGRIEDLLEERGYRVVVQ
jgi:translation initiation factor 1